MKKISLIVATYNSARYLKAALESVTDFLGPAYELIFVDGGSTDETLSIIEHYGRGSILLRQRSRGLYEALNEGVAAATAPWIAFLHSDDLWINPPTIEEIPSSPSEEILVGDVSFFRTPGEILYTRSLRWFPRRALRTFPFIFHPNAIYPRQLLLAHPYNERLHGRRADMYQIAELAKSMRFRRLNSFKYGFRIHAGSTTVAGVKNNSDERLLFWFWRIYVFLFWEDRRLARMRGMLTGRRIWKEAS